MRELGIPMRNVVLLIVLLFGAVLAVIFAQQSSPSVDWHPQLSEDNKNASWEDTASFMNQWLDTTAKRGGWSAWDSISPSRCSLQVKLGWVDTEFNSNASRWTRADEELTHFRRVEATVDVTKIDPLAIGVTRGTELTIQGTGNSIFLHGTETYWIGNGAFHGASVRDMVCPSDIKNEKGLKSCSVKPVDAYKWSFFFDSEESAKRYARALMHAALLCGGTKAVSPF